MKIRHQARRAAVITIALAASSVTALLASPAAGASAPPWQVSSNINHDPNALGVLSFFDAAGTQIYGGSVDDAPIAAYIVGSDPIEAGDTKSTLYGYLPQAGSPAAGWSGEALGAASTYPNAGAPAGISQTLPVFTGSAVDATITALSAAFPNPSTDADYQHIYELRLRTSSPGNPTPAGYDVADIKVTGDQWQVVYPGDLTATSTALAVSPSTGVKAGGTVTLTATVTPAAAGTVQFAEGATHLGTPVTVTSGHATKAVKLSTVGTHSFTATFEPTDLHVFAASQGAASAVAGKSTTTTTATWPAGRPVYTKAFTVRASVKSVGIVPTGSVTVSYGSKKLATRTLANGAATLTVPAKALTPGSRKLSVTYSGSTNSAPSSTSKTITVAKVTSRTANTLSPAKVFTTQHAKLGVVVAASGVIPTGTVRIYDGSKLIKSITLRAANKGKGTVTLPRFKVGRHRIHAAYAGSSLVAASTAGQKILTVAKKKKK